MNQIKINIFSYSMICIDQNATVLRQIGFDSCPEFSVGSKNFLKNVPSMHKRRLGNLGKAILPVYYASAANNTNKPLVFSSNHGNIHLTYGLLKTMIEDDELSPTAFSLSVHNAIAGIISIIDENKNDIVAIAPGENGVLPALIEAMAVFNRQPDTKEIGVIFYDTFLPGFYLQHSNYQSNYSVFAACTIVSDCSRDKHFTVTFDCNHPTREKKQEEHQQQIESFFECLDRRQKYRFSAFNTDWQCSVI
jgi:hypothetical protein